MRHEVLTLHSTSRSPQLLSDGRVDGTDDEAAATVVAIAWVVLNTDDTGQASTVKHALSQAMYTVLYHAGAVT